MIICVDWCYCLWSDWTREPICLWWCHNRKSAELRPPPTDEQLRLYAITHTPFTQTHTHTVSALDLSIRCVFVSESLCVSPGNQDAVIIIVLIFSITLLSYCILGQSCFSSSETEPIIERFYAFAKFINVWSASTIESFKQTVLHSFLIHAKLFRCYEWKLLCIIQILQTVCQNRKQAMVETRRLSYCSKKKHRHFCFKYLLK